MFRCFWFIWNSIIRCMEMNNTEDFKRKCQTMGITLSEKQLAQFMDYYELLTEWNSFMNLTAITEFEEVVLKHFVDSLAICQTNLFMGSVKNKFFTHEICVCDTNSDALKSSAEMGISVKKSAKEKGSLISLIDIGTGAGFPGIPLKIVFPEIRITLLDSLKKRIHFLEEVIEKLALKDIATIHGRAEDFAKQPEYREQYDFCVSRAVANLASLSELCIPFVKENGYFISYKSEKTKEELTQAENAISILGGKTEKQIEYILPESDIKRTLLFIKKEKQTPNKYPRRAGIPVKEPLK